MREQNIEKFFAYARAREQIRIDRENGLPRPWTKDKILQTGRFCNVFREDDKTTRWFAKHVRNPFRGQRELLLATVVFRMFNRMETGEAIFCDDNLDGESSAFHSFAKSGNTYDMKHAIMHRIGSGPYTTGAYIVSSPPGKKKLDGVLWILTNFYKKSGWQEWVDNDPAASECSLEAAWEWLREQDYLGPFHSYEIVTDLRHTPLLEQAPDINLWANPGPGAKRGLRRLHGALAYRGLHDEMMSDMRRLLLLSRESRLWPKAWPRWEMRDVEHTLCEFDKYERVRLGQGRMKGKFDGR